MSTFESFTLEDVREAIRPTPEIHENHQADYIVFTYVVCKFDTFPNPATAPDEKTAFHRKIRRECRGLIFNAQTGRLVSRRYQKFFNVDELDETKAENIDVNRPYILLEKMDGSMIAPFFSEGKLFWATRSGKSKVANTVHEYINSLRNQTNNDNNNTQTHETNYEQFVSTWIEKGFTPLFEWCSPKNLIVLTYGTDSLTLTGLRHNETGRYLPYAEMMDAAKEFNIPGLEGSLRCPHVVVVKCWDGKVLEDNNIKFASLREWIVHMRSKIDIEGFVLRFDDGFMVKIKTEWYFAINKGLLQNMFTTERDLWLAVLDNKHDDFRSIMRSEQRDQLDKFATDLVNAIVAKATEITQTVNELKNTFPERKDFAREVTTRKLPWKNLLFDVFDGKDPQEVVIKYLKKQLAIGKQSHDMVRPLVGNIKFDDFLVDKLPD